MKLLIYAINGRGMGHLNRTLVLARAVRMVDPSVEIQFVVRSPLFGIVSDAGFEVTKVPDNHHKLGRYALRSGAQAHMSRVFDGILSCCRPDWFLIDFVVEPQLFRAAKRHKAGLSLLLRAQRSEEMAALSKKSCMSDVDRFLLPHDSSEFPLSELPVSWRSRSQHLGPLARALDPEGIAPARARYAEEAERLVVVSIGGGGFAESYRTLELAEQVALRLPSDGGGRGIQWVIVYGPYYPDPIPSSEDKITRLRYEADLLELFAAADVVVCNAGYNTLSEIQVCGTPAVVIPLTTTGRDDQHQRAKRLVASGRAVLAAENADELLLRVRILLGGEAVHRRPPEFSEAALEVGKAALNALEA